VLNLAAIETRAEGGQVTTAVRSDAPPLRLVVGAVGESPGVATLYQQLHGYPVGSSGQQIAPRTHGAKFWIAPVRREVLVGLDCVLGVEASIELRDRVAAGLRGELNGERYGLPFAGDNNFLFDRIEILEVPPAARWSRPVDVKKGPARESCRLTVAIDRGDSSKTTKVLFAPTELLPLPPDDAWVWTPRAP
jgi:CRISPR-associated protein Cas5t